MKANVKTAIVLGFFVVVALISIVYAFVQQTKAKRQEEIANQIMQKSEEQERGLRIAIEETNQQLAIAEAEKLIAIKMLEDCKSSQKKN